MTKLFENAIKAAKPDGPYTEGAIPYTYDLGLNDMRELIEMATSGNKSAAFWAIEMAFNFGFVMGNRATHSRKLRRL